MKKIKILKIADGHDIKVIGCDISAKVGRSNVQLVK